MKAIMNEIIDIEVGEDEAGQRLDSFLADKTEHSRSRIKALIEAGNLSLGGEVISKLNTKVKTGQIYKLNTPAPIEAEPEPENIALDIIFEDEHLIVINKQAGLTVHPAVGNWSGTLVNALLYHCGDSLSGIGGVLRPGIVHRIDKDTTGLLVIAKNDKTHRGLSKQFEKHTIERVYICLVRSAPMPREGRIETRLARSPHDRKKMAVAKQPDDFSIARGAEPNGKIAITNYKFLKGYGKQKGASLATPLVSKIECRLETGRTHQIRVHMSHIGCPILGDNVYGRVRAYKSATSEAESILREALSGFERQALHAKTLGFEHPITKEQLSFDSELPKDMQKLEEAFVRL